MKQAASDIIKNKDVRSLVALGTRDAANVCVSLVYSHFSKYDSLNHEQKILLLCVRLEDACQADSILSLSEEEELFLRLPDICKAHEEIGAPKTAALIKQFMDLLPEETFSSSKVPAWEWFFEDEARNQKINDIDGQICNYPDGFMRELYHRYLAKDGVAAKLFENI